MQETLRAGGRGRGGPRTPSPRAKTCGFCCSRPSRELLFNVVKHAGAGRARVTTPDAVRRPAPAGRRRRGRRLRPGQAEGRRRRPAAASACSASASGWNCWAGGWKWTPRPAAAPASRSSRPAAGPTSPEPPCDDLAADAGQRIAGIHSDRGEDDHDHGKTRLEKPLRQVPRPPGRRPSAGPPRRGRRDRPRSRPGGLRRGRRRGGSHAGGRADPARPGAGRSGA